VRDQAGSLVRSGHQAGTGITALTNISVPEPGDYTAQVWVGDEAGNVNPANKSSSVHLKFDDAPPGDAAPTSANHWIGAREAATLGQRIAMEPDALIPASGIAGYSVTTDGTDPDASIDVAGQDATYPLRELPEGMTIFKVRAISGS